MMNLDMLHEPTVIGGLIMASLAVFFFLIAIFYMWRRTKQKSIDVYGFNLTGWKNLKDPQMLYEIEQNFKSGTLSKVLGTTNYKLSEFHSNQINEKGTLTGFVQLTNYSNVNGIDFDGDIIIGDAITDQKSYRYISSPIPFNGPSVVVIDSKCQSEKWTKNVIGAFDRDFGPLNWKIIIVQQQLYFLTHEIFDKAKLLSLLSTHEQFVDEFAGA